MDQCNFILYTPLISVFYECKQVGHKAVKEAWN